MLSWTLLWNRLACLQGILWHLSMFSLVIFKHLLPKHFSLHKGKGSLLRVSFNKKKNVAYTFWLWGLYIYLYICTKAYIYITWTSNCLNDISCLMELSILNQTFLLLLQHIHQTNHHIHIFIKPIKNSIAEPNLPMVTNGYQKLMPIIKM